MTFEMGIDLVEIEFRKVSDLFEVFLKFWRWACCLQRYSSQRQLRSGFLLSVGWLVSLWTVFPENRALDFLAFRHECSLLLGQETHTAVFPGKFRIIQKWRKGAFLGTFSTSSGFWRKSSLLLSIFEGLKWKLRLSVRLPRKPHVRENFSWFLT